MRKYNICGNSLLGIFKVCCYGSSNADFENIHRTFIDVGIGSFDSAELYELIGYYLQWQMTQLLPKNQYGLYRDDNLTVMRGTNIYGHMAGHNKKVLNPDSSLKVKGCKCQAAEVNPYSHIEEEVKKVYIGSTCNTWRSRYSGHKSSFKLPQYETATTLSSEIWRLKRLHPNFDYNVKWSIQKLARAYTRESKLCHLCLAEKTMIMYMDKSNALNKHTELFRKCPHYEKHRLSSW